MKVPVLALCFISLLAAGQNQRPEGFEKENYSLQQITIRNNDTAVIRNANFQYIRITDLRADTFSTGYKLKGRAHNNFFQKLEFVSPASLLYYLAGNKEGRVSENGTAAIICFLKRLRLTDHAVVKDPDETAGKSSKVRNETFETGLVAEADIFIQTQQDYTPLFRFDTVITGRKKSSSGSHLFIEEFLDTLIARINRTDPFSVIQKGKKRTPTEVNQYYQNLGNSKVLYEQPVKGIFRRFEDFRQNKPDNTGFSLKKEDKNDFLYIIKADGSEVLETDIWGYCDGKYHYIYQAGNFFRLHRTGNTYSFWGAKEMTSTRTLRANFGTGTLLMGKNSAYSKSQTASRYNLFKVPLQLDLINGEIY